MRIGRRESIKYSPYWDKFWTKETERNLEEVTSCHWDNKILKISIKQVFLSILLLLSLKSGIITHICKAAKNSKGFIISQSNCLGFFYLPQISRGVGCNLLVPARWAQALHQPRRADVFRAHGNCAWLHYSPQFINSCRSQKIFRHPTDPISLFNYSRNSL